MDYKVVDLARKEVPRDCVVGNLGAASLPPEEPMSLQTQSDLMAAVDRVQSAQRDLVKAMQYLDRVRERNGLIRQKPRVVN